MSEFLPHDEAVARNQKALADIQAGLNAIRSIVQDAREARDAERAVYLEALRTGDADDSALVAVHARFKALRATQRQLEKRFEIENNAAQFVSA